MGLFGLFAAAAAAIAGYYWFNRGNDDTRTYYGGSTSHYDYDLSPKRYYTAESSQYPTVSYDVQPASIKKKEKLRLIDRLDVYRPDEQLVDLNNASGENAFIRDLLGREIHAHNIHEIYRTLLQLEDVELLRTYLPLIQKKVLVKKLNATDFEVETSLNMESVVTPFCDEVIVIPLEYESNLQKYVVPGNDGVYSKFVAIVTDVYKRKLRFSYNKPIDSLRNGVKINLIVRPRREPCRYQRRALDLLRRNSQVRQYLFPTFSTFMPNSISLHSISLVNENIAKNPEQCQAVIYIAGGAGKTAPYIVFGPPGTGKTTTIVESILQIWLKYPQCRILVTAGSNSACDTIALKLCQYFDKNYSSATPLLRIYSKGIIQRMNIKDIPKSIKKRSNLEWIEGKHEYPAVVDVDKYNIVIATLGTIGKYELAHFSRSKPFKYIFIDEAGASTEPEALVGIMAVNSTSTNRPHVILSGDHKQLGPVIKSKKASELGLERSLMERLLGRPCYAVNKEGQYDFGFQVRLKRNYRSDPEIVKLYNYLYYNNDLISMRSVINTKKWSFLPNPMIPIGFQAVYGESEKGPTQSWCNKLEIEVLMAYVKELLKACAVSEDEIGVITPYKFQCELIQSSLEARNWRKVEVGSVENFQGREKSVIIASMVRSKCQLGFVKSERRWNVLLSRPESLLLILGNPATLNKFDDIKYVIDECERAGNYLGKNNFVINESSEVQNGK